MVENWIATSFTIFWLEFSHKHDARIIMKDRPWTFSFIVLVDCARTAKLKRKVGPSYSYRPYSGFHFFFFNRWATKSYFKMKKGIR
jgi:hypothetical protein